MPVKPIFRFHSINHIPVRPTYRRHFLCVLRYLLAELRGAEGRRTVVAGNLGFGDSVLWELSGKRVKGLHIFLPQPVHQSTLYFALYKFALIYYNKCYTARFHKLFLCQLPNKLPAMSPFHQNECNCQKRQQSFCYRLCRQRNPFL